jgi:hypothetical protein
MNDKSMKFGAHLEETLEKFLTIGPVHISLATKMAAIFKMAAKAINYGSYSYIVTNE